MRFDRRAMLAGIAASPLVSALTVRTAVAAAATPAAPATPPPSLKDKLIARAKDARLRVDFDGQKYSGAGWDFLVREGTAAQFFLLGEEHGTVQVPKLAAQLMLALKPAGYERLAVEVSAPTAIDLDRAAQRGIDGLRVYTKENTPGAVFYNYKDEAEFLAAVRPAFPATPQLIWGLDYEVIQDRRLIARLKAKAPSSAHAAVQALQDAANAAWQKFSETHGPQFLFSFSGDPALVRAVRAAWPRPDAECDVILEVLEGTLETNALWVQQRSYESNDRRTRLMRGMLSRYWKAEKAHGRAPRTCFKFGSSHMQRGRDISDVYDIGELAASIATLEGGTSFHLAAGPTKAGQHGNFNPAEMTVVPGPGGGYFEELGIEFLSDLAYPEGMTVIDLRPLRPILGGRTAQLPYAANNTILGFDAILIMPAATSTTML